MVPSFGSILLFLGEGFMVIWEGVRICWVVSFLVQIDLLFCLLVRIWVCLEMLCCFGR